MDFSNVFRRWAAACITGGVLVFAAAVMAYDAYSSDTTPVKVDDKNATGNEWPMFGGTLARNLVNLKETNIPSEAAVLKGKEKNVKWSADLGSKAYGGPVISGGKVFIGTNNGKPRNPAIVGDKGVLMCFDEKSGKFLWQQVHKKLEAGRVNDWPDEGICSSPFIEGDHFYYVTNRSEVICAKTSDGTPLWTFDMIAKLKNFPHNLSTCSPLVAGETLYLITSNGVDEGHINIPEPEAPSFIALNKKTGDLQWKSSAPTDPILEARKAGKTVDIKQMINKGEVLMHGQWSNPVYAEPNGRGMIIFPGGDGWMRGFDPKNGELLWKFDCNPKGTFYELGAEATRNDFVCTPVVWKDKLYISVGQDPEHLKGVGHLWCIDIAKKPANKEKDLSPVDNNFDPKAAVNKDSGLVWHYGGYLDPKPKRGRNYKYGRSMSTCAVHDGLCYAADFDGHFYCFDALSGKLNYEFNMNAETWSSPTWIDGHIYIGNEEGKLFVFKHGATEKEPLNTIAMTVDPDIVTRIRATPIACNGVLYVMTEDPCMLWAISPGGK
jgi:outer membrane protein assembly factor BamB